MMIFSSWLFLCLRKSDKEVGEEIPQRNHANGKELGHVEIDLEVFQDQPYHQIIDPQTNNGNDQEGRIFGDDLRIIALEGPDTVEHIIGGGRQRKTDGIGDVLLYLENLLENVGKKVIDKEARKSDRSEFQKFQDKGTCQEIEHLRLIQAQR